MSTTARAWSAIRTVLQAEFSFYDIKEIVGLAGVDLTLLAHLEQKAGGGASKGQLMTGIDKVLSRLSEAERTGVMAIVAEEVLRRRPSAREKLDEYLVRLGWTLVEQTLVPIELFEPTGLADMDAEAGPDLVKAAQRYRDGDLSGAISAACGAIDSVTSKVYAEAGLGDPGKASFQERCKKALDARGIAADLERQLSDLGWGREDVGPFKKNFEGALNQGAYVIQTLRSRMGDVHGTKPILRPLVFDCLKWAELMIRTLKGAGPSAAAPGSGAALRLFES